MHYTILAKPISINTSDKENKKVKRRDMKDSNWRDSYLPEKTVIIHQNDRPWMTKELKSMIKKGKQPLLNMAKIRDSIRGGEIKSRKRSKALRLLIISIKYQTL